MLFWRVMKNSIPFRCSLLSRGLSVETSCPVCAIGDETLLYSLWDCSYTRLMWVVSPLSNNLTHYSTEILLDWIEYIHSKSTKYELELFVALCWSLWGNRNKLVYENKVYDAGNSVRFV